MAENLAVRPSRTAVEIEMHGVLRTGKGTEWCRAAQLANLRRTDGQNWKALPELRRLIQEKGAPGRARCEGGVLGLTDRLFVCLFLAQKQRIWLEWLNRGLVRWMLRLRGRTWR